MIIVSVSACILIISVFGMLVGSGMWLMCLSGWLVTVVPFWLSEVVIKLVLTKETGESIILVNIPGVYVSSSPLFSLICVWLSDCIIGHLQNLFVKWKIWDAGKRLVDLSRFDYTLLPTVLAPFISFTFILQRWR